MSDEAVEKKQIIKIRTNQSDCNSLQWPGRSGPADIRNRFPLSTPVCRLCSAGILLCSCFAEKLGPAWDWALAGLTLPVSGQSPERAETRVIPDWDILGQDNYQESVNRSSYVKLVHNWAGREGGVRSCYQDLVSRRDQLVHWCLSTIKYPAGRLWIDWM